MKSVPRAIMENVINNAIIRVLLGKSRVHIARKKIFA